MITLTILFPLFSLWAQLLLPPRHENRVGLTDSPRQPHAVCWLQCAGCSVLDAVCWLQCAGCSVLDAVCWQCAVYFLSLLWAFQMLLAALPLLYNKTFPHHGVGVLAVYTDIP